MVAHQVHSLKARFESSDRKDTYTSLHVACLDTQPIVSAGSGLCTLGAPTPDEMAVVQYTDFITFNYHRL